MGEDVSCFLHNGHFLDCNRIGYLLILTILSIGQVLRKDIPGFPPFWEAMKIMLQELARYYDSLASRRDDFRRKNRYYYALLDKQYRYFVPEGKKVLEIGCGTGDLLAALKPSYGMGVDISPKMIEMAKEKYPSLHFYAGTIQDITIEEKFDYIILSGLLGELEDIQTFLQSLRRFCTPDTRIIIEYYSYFWQPLLKIAEALGRKMPQREQNWLTFNDISNFLELAGFETIKKSAPHFCLLISGASVFFLINIWPNFLFLMP